MNQNYFEYDITKFDIDPAKKTIGIFGKHFYDRKQNFASQYAETLFSELEKEYNLVFFLITKNRIHKNCFMFNRDFEKFLERYGDNPSQDVIDQNDKKIKDEIVKHIISIIPKFDYILTIGSIFTIPSNKFFGKKVNIDLYNRSNQYYDIVDEDLARNPIIEDKNKEIATNISRYVSPYSFLQSEKHFVFIVIKTLFDQGCIKNKVISILDDPGVFYPFFSVNNIPHKIFYWENDFRGNRNFHKFDHAQIWHCVQEEKKKNESMFSILEEETENSNNFLFYGTIFHTYSTARSIIWEQYLKHFYYPNSKYFIPVKSGWTRIYQLSYNEKDKNKLIEYDKELFLSVTNHPLFSNDQDEFPITKKTVSKFKYSFVARCSSFSDSLNLRPVLYSLSNTLPLLDERYDPSYLQIPKEIANNLVVFDHVTMKNKIDYFEQNRKEAIDIIKELRSIFRIDEWLTFPDEMLKKEIAKLFRD